MQTTGITHATGLALVVSIHDVCPLFENAVARWLSILDGWGIARRSLAVVPAYERGKRVADSHSLVSMLVREVRGGSEVVLHGYHHILDGGYARIRDRLRDRVTTHGCAEFSCVALEEARERLSRGLTELEQVLPIPVRGFTAPGWWQAPGIAELLRDMGFHFYTSTWAVVGLNGGRRFASPVLTGLPHPKGLTAALLRAYNFGLLPSAMRRRTLFRVALHPYDLENSGFVEAVGRLLRRLTAERGTAVYEDLFPRPAEDDRTGVES
ncbi:DUF2334 domain-containing protein [Verrucomicrobiota bacterium]